jgi:hypothetical protein
VAERVCQHCDSLDIHTPCDHIVRLPNAASSLKDPPV